jgi:hypothetical protein
MSIYDKEAPSSGGAFIKFKGGDKVRLRMFGTPIEYTAKFKDQDPKIQFASLAIVPNKDTKEYECKLFNFGWMIQKQLAALAKDSDWGDPTQYDVEVVAEGDGMDRKYQVVPKPKKDLDSKAQAAIESCDLDMRKLLKLDDTPHSEPEEDPFE